MGPLAALPFPRAYRAAETQAQAAGKSRPQKPARKRGSPTVARKENHGQQTERAIVRERQQYRGGGSSHPNRDEPVRTTDPPAFRPGLGQAERVSQVEKSGISIRSIMRETFDLIRS